MKKHLLFVSVLRLRGNLVVENNLQRRIVRVEFNGVGLSNIADKYRLLNRPAKLIEEADGWFQIEVGLLQSGLQSMHSIS